MRRTSTLAALVALALASPARADDNPPAPKPEAEKPASAGSAAEKPADKPASAPAPAAPTGPTGATAPTGSTGVTGAINNLPALMNRPHIASTPEAPADLKPELIPAFNVSVLFFQALADHDVDRLSVQTRAPFTFEGKSVATPDETRKRWGRALGDLGRNNLTLYGVEVLTYEDMVRKYGKAPAKLGDLGGTKGLVVAVGNLNGRACLAFLRRDNQGLWRVVGYSD